MPKTEAGDGWGRVAVSRFAKSDEDVKAEILKALEGKLSVEFQDYSQWQRDSLPVVSSSQPSSKTSIRVKSKTVSTSSRPQTGHSGATACSSLCLHPWNKKPVPVDDTAEILKQERILLLQAQISARKHSVDAYKKLQEDLQSLNSSLQHEIQTADRETNRNVTKLLEKYEKCSASSKVMTHRHIADVKMAKEDFEITKRITDNEITELEAQLLHQENQLHFFLQDLQVLRTYKDKEYPAKAMTITKLQNNVHHQAQRQKAELNELKRIISGEENQMIASRESKTLAILNNAADSIYHSSTPGNLEKLAFNNSTLRHEIELNSQSNAEIMDEIKKLRAEVSELKKMKQTKVRQFVFPEVHHPTAICGPEEEVVLDIPKQRQLPV